MSVPMIAITTSNSTSVKPASRQADGQAIRSLHGFVMREFRPTVRLRTCNNKPNWPNRPDWITPPAGFTQGTRSNPHTAENETVEEAKRLA